jgi:hypothetical protein
MGRISFQERQRVNHELKKMGFGGLEDSRMLEQIATLYTTHDAFRGLLMSTAPDQRRIAYESLKPHLAFVAKPLDQYEREIHERAEREQWDVYDGTAYPKPFKVGEVESDEYRLHKAAAAAIQQNLHEKEKGLHLTCAKCTRVETFKAPTRKQADKDSHLAGWRSDGKKNWCQNCVPARGTFTIECQACDRVDRIRAWDPQDAYAAARLVGWVIENACTCASCAMKNLAPALPN